jgi:hypothetical protein
MQALRWVSCEKTVKNCETFPVALETHLTLLLRRLAALSSCRRGVVVVLVVVVLLENLRRLGAVALLLLCGEAEASEHWV